MTTALKELLDDVAADAVAGLRVDLDDVLERSRRRRWRFRTTGSLMMLAAAAAVVLAVAVPLTLVAPVSPAAQGQGKVGLPDHWYFAPSFAPPVTRLHMSAASMLLGGDGSSPVLVSADSRTYARLPWGPDDAMAALSADGTQVAWATQGGRSTVHLLRTATGRQLDVALPAGSGHVLQLVWAGTEVYARTDGGMVVLVIQADGRASATVVCSCRPQQLGSYGVGQLAYAPNAGPGGAGPPGATSVPMAGIIDSAPIADAPSWSRWRVTAEQPAWSYESSPVLAVSPGTATASVIHGAADDGSTEWSLAFPGTRSVGNSVPVMAGLAITDVEILAWVRAGIVLRIETLDAPAGRRNVSLRLVDPAGGRSTLLSTKLEGAAVPMAVAAGLIGDGKPIESDPPDFPSWDRGRVEYAAQQLWRSNYPYWQLITLAALTSLVVLAVVRRRRR